MHVALTLAHPGALTPCDEKHIVNRSVRPLLRGLTKVVGAGGPASFFGRDWVSIAHRPAAWVGFAHDATTRRTLFEAFVAVRTPFAITERPSFRGKAQGTVELIANRALAPDRVAEAIAEAYASGTDWFAVDMPTPGDELDLDDPRIDPPWAATCDEAIGTLGAGKDARGMFRVGGDLLVSRDALGRLEYRAAGASEGDIGLIVNETLGAPGVALDGVRSLGNVRDMIVRARG